jgi:hypothetical protein
MASKTTSLKMHYGVGQFTPEKVGQFGAERVGQFAAESVDHFERKFQKVSILNYEAQIGSWLDTSIR